MKNRLLFLIGTILVGAILGACGGGGGGGGGASSSSTDSGAGGGAKATTPTYSGYFYDAPTKGLAYTTSSGYSGITDASGLFRFNDGETVAFSIPAGGSVSVQLGSVIPVTPNNALTTAYVHVLSMPNGAVIAQTLQSLQASGGNGSIIDVSSVSLSASQALAISQYISSGGAITAPSQITVSLPVATAIASAAIGAIPYQAPTISAQPLISGNTYFAQGVISLTDINNAPLLDGHIKYFNPNGQLVSYCINMIPAGSYKNGCGTFGIANIDTWSISSNNLNTVLESYTPGGAPISIRRGKEANTYNFLVANAKAILYKANFILNGPPNQATGAGIYTAVKNSFSIASLAGKTLTIAGFPDCNYGLMNYVFSVDGKSYSKSCQTSKVNDSANIPISGYSKDLTYSVGISNTIFPGIVQLNDSQSFNMFYDTGATIYLGITSDSSLNSGIAMIAKVGDYMQCSLSNASYCGSIGSFPFVIQ